MIGIALGFNCVASKSLLIISYPRNEVVGYMAMYEMASGFGIVTGSVFGGLMFSLGSYVMPFGMMALIYLIATPIMIEELSNL